MKRSWRTRALVAVAATVAPAAAIAAWIARPLPPDLAAPGPVPSLVLEDRNGHPLRATRAEDGSRAGWLPLADIDPEILQAFIAAEDRRFFDHHGIDGRAAARAARDNVRAGRIVSGASTLTMQVARLLRPSPRTVPGKLQQALWALRIEAHTDKGRILETYLNRVPLGQGTVGIDAAARLYFASPASDVSLGQAALLAGLARLPSRENPFASLERARDRRDIVLERMVRLGYATRGDADLAAREPVLADGGEARFAAPHFTTRILRTADRVTGTIRTTLDLRLQRDVEAEVRHTVWALRDRAARHAAAVVLENRTGDVLAWVGSPDFFADTAGQVDMVAARRQPGSTLKPFLYGLALDRGWTAASILPDVPRSYVTTTGPYRPQNYDRRFRGPVRIREALASSYNVPAVELTERLGTPALLTVLRDAGFASLDRPPDHYGLGLALGNGEVTLLELANAYRGLANGGVRRPVRWTTEAAYDGAEHRFLTPGATALVLDILRDPVARVPGFGTATPLDLPFDAAAKTGTSRHFTDNWAVAATANFTVAVWVGNFSGRPMRGVSGITGAGPLLHRIALHTARSYPPGRLPPPDAAGAEPVRVCALSGLRASPRCAALVEWFLPGTAPDDVDDWERDGVRFLPAEYAEWIAAGEPVAGDARLLAVTPDARSGPDPRIVSPLDGDMYEVPVGVAARYATLPLVAAPADGVRWRIDGRWIGGNRWPLEPGRHVVTAEWPGGRRESVRIEVAPRAN